MAFNLPSLAPLSHHCTISCPALYVGVYTHCPSPRLSFLYANPLGLPSLVLRLYHWTLGKAGEKPSFSFGFLRCTKRGTRGALKRGKKLSLPSVLPPSFISLTTCYPSSEGMGFNNRG